MRRLVVLLGLACPLLGCGTSIRRDHLLEPKPEGTRLTGFAYLGPGARVAVDNRLDIEEGSTQWRNQVHANATFGYAEAVAHTDLRLMVLTLGGSVGYRYSWHLLQFEPDANGLDNGQPELNRQARIDKDKADDFYATHWPWGEGRAQVVLPFGPVTAITTVSYRYEDRPDNSYSWEFATVYDGGGLVNWETVIFLRHRHLGFIGPAVRLFNLPRGGEREHELQYGIAGGTAPGWSDVDHSLILRVYTNAGFDDELMGTHFFRIPIQVVIGYQQDFEL